MKWKVFKNVYLILYLVIVSKNKSVGCNGIYCTSENPSIMEEWHTYIPYVILVLLPLLLLLFYVKPKGFRLFVSTREGLA